MLCHISHKKFEVRHATQHHACPPSGASGTSARRRRRPRRRSGGEPALRGLRGRGRGQAPRPAQAPGRRRAAGLALIAAAACSGAGPPAPAAGLGRPASPKPNLAPGQAPTSVPYGTGATVGMAAGRAPRGGEDAGGGAQYLPGRWVSHLHLSPPPYLDRQPPWRQP